MRARAHCRPAQRRLSLDGEAHDVPCDELGPGKQRKKRAKTRTGNERRGQSGNDGEEEGKEPSIEQ